LQNQADYECACKCHAYSNESHLGSAENYLVRQQNYQLGKEH
jgi:hypothetical protein